MGKGFGWHRDILTQRIDAVAAGTTVLELSSTGSKHVGANVPITTLTTATEATAGNVTITIAQLIGGYVARDPNGGARTDTLPTAALLVAGIPDAAVGDSFDCIYENTANGAEVVTLAAGSNGTAEGVDLTLAQNESALLRFLLTNVTAASETYKVFVFVNDA